jgi:NADP-dependent 3-hydroxy acid dehydrogenase YdfG
MFNKYAITSATGNTGNAIANALLDAGFTVHVLSREHTKLSNLENKGAIPFIGKAFHDFLRSTNQGDQKQRLKV